MTDEKNNLALEPPVDVRRQGHPQPGLEEIITAIDQAVATQQPTNVAAMGKENNERENAKGRLAPGKYIVFTLAEGKYAVPINQVMEVGEPQRITPVPNVPDWVLGVTNLRGDIISVVDCGAFLQLHDKIAPEVSSMCVVRNKRRDLTTSLMVDRIEGMLNLAEDLIVVPETSHKDRLTDYLHGLFEYDGSLLKVLNLEGLLSSMELN